MTRIAGNSVIAPPCCQTSLTTLRYASMNFSAFEHWTDGRDVGGLMTQDGGLCKCTCGRYFLRSQTEEIGFLPNRKSRPPPNWDKVSLLTRVMGKAQAERQRALEMYDTRPEEEIAAEEALLPPAAIAVHDPELPEVIAQAQGDRAMLIVARRRYWRYLGDQFRDEYRQFKKDQKEGFPPYAPSAAQMDNMEQLAALLEGHEMVDELELGELYREMGQPLKARAKLAKVGEDDLKLCDMQLSLLEKGYSGPARFKY